MLTVINSYGATENEVVCGSLLTLELQVSASLLMRVREFFLMLSELVQQWDMCSERNDGEYAG